MIRFPLIVAIILGILFELINLFHIIFAIKFHWEKSYYENDYILDLCFTHIFYKLFSTKLKYKHHIVSTLFILFCAIGYYVIEIIFYKYYYTLIFIIIKQFLFGICLVFIEYLMKAKRYSIFLVIMIFGLTGLLIDLIVLIIVSNFACIGPLKNNICSAGDFEINKLSSYLYKQKYILRNGTNEGKSNDYYIDHAQYFYDYFKAKLDIEGAKFFMCTFFFSICSAFSIFFCFLIVKKKSPIWNFFTDIIISGE